MLASWAKNTQSSYQTYINKWLDFCTKNDISDPYMPNYDNAMLFLSSLYKNHAKYGYIAAARSALSAIMPKKEGKTFGQNENVSKLLVSIYTSPLHIQLEVHRLAKRTILGCRWKIFKRRQGGLTTVRLENIINCLHRKTLGLRLPMRIKTNLWACKIFIFIG